MLKQAAKVSLVVLLSTAVFAQKTPPATPHAGAQIQHTYKSKKLSRAQLDALLAHPDHVLLIDVRKPDEIAVKGGFPVYLSIQVKDLGNHLGEIPRNRTIVTVSNHAARALAAADLLSSKGFNVAGAAGAQLYEAEGGTLLKFPPAQTSTNVTHGNPSQSANSAGGK